MLCVHVYTTVDHRVLSNPTSTPTAVSFICWFTISTVLACVLWSLQPHEVAVGDKGSGHTSMADVQTLLESNKEYSYTTLHAHLLFL